MQRTFLAQNPSVLWFIAILAVFTIAVTLLSEATGVGVISTSFVKTLGKTLCLCLVAIAMDVVWGYCGILSLGHFAFFGIGGYAIGMWLMYARTELIVIESLAAAPLPLRGRIDPAAIAAIRAGDTKYTAVDGTPAVVLKIQKQPEANSQNPDNNGTDEAQSGQTFAKECAPIREHHDHPQCHDT